MKHIFIVHSNTTAICIYPFIKELVTRKEEAVVVLTRGYSWPFHQDENDYQIIDASFVESNMISSKEMSSNYLKRIANRLEIEKIIDEEVDKIMGNDQIILYTPHLNIIFSRNFLKRENCKGYYFIEEGFMSYTPIDVVNKKHRYPLCSRVFHMLIGRQSYDPYYTKHEKFIGTLSFSDDAFLWNHKIKKVVNVDSIEFDTIKHVENLVVCGYFKEKVNDIEKCIDLVVKYAHDNNLGTIGIKFHPHAYFMNKDKIEIITAQFMDSVVILPSDYVAELLLLKTHPNVFNVGEFSSLSMYAKKWGCNVFNVDIDECVMKKC